jgi:CBS domain-containing protein
MIVKDILKGAVATCAPESDLQSVIDVMRHRDCGFLPVVDSHGIVVGVITDRDICIAGSSKQRPWGRVSVKETMSHPVFSCFADENVKVVLATMAKHRVRRLPVLNKSGHLEGVLSMDDIVSAPSRRGGPTADEIVAALKGIYAAQRIEAVTA